MISGVCSLINGLITAGSWFVCANKSWWLVVNNNGNRRNWVRVLTGKKILLHNQALVKVELDRSHTLINSSTANLFIFLASVELALVNKRW